MFKTVQKQLEPQDMRRRVLQFHPTGPYFFNTKQEDIVAHVGGSLLNERKARFKRETSTMREGSYTFTRRASLGLATCLWLFSVPDPSLATFLFRVGRRRRL